MFTGLLLVNKHDAPSCLRYGGGDKRWACTKKPRAMLLAFLFLLFTIDLNSQVNYVLNPSFEQVDSCPAFYNKIKALYWDTLINGGGYDPDLMTTCYAGTGLWSIVGVPKNIFGRSYQQPRTGKNYHNFLLLRPGRNIIDYIQGTLIKTLVKKNYCITYHVNLTNNSQYAIDKIGAYLDDGSIHTPPGQTTLVPTSVSSPSGVFISDTLNWTKVQGIYFAKGNETKITLGNFTLNGSTNSLFVNPTAADDYALYFIDDVSVIEADLPAFAGRDTVLCTGDSVFIGRPPEIGLECLWFNTSTGSVQIATGGGLWVKPSTTQTFIVQQDVCGLIKKDTIQVQIKPKYTGPAIGLAANTATACATNIITFTVSNNPPGTNTYNWLPIGVYSNTNNTSASAVIAQSAAFTININNAGQNAFCPFTRSASVSVSVPVFTDSPTLISNLNSVCPNDTINLSFLNPAPGNTVTYQWLPKSSFTFTSALSAKSVTQFGNSYSVNISSTGNASICPFTRSLSISIAVADTCFKEPIIPNIFTPNNDDANDLWSIKFSYGYSLQELEIYDRWGTLIYKQENLKFDKQGYALIGWDGYTTSGEPCSAGVYFYIVKYSDRSNATKIVKGNVSLVK